MSPSRPSTGAPSTLGSRSCSEDAQDDEDSEEDDYDDGEDEYSAFLREMAGSFEATTDDEDEEEEQEESNETESPNQVPANGAETVDQDEYEIFLRGMAGSYQPDTDDDDSETEMEITPSNRTAASPMAPVAAANVAPVVKEGEQKIVALIPGTTTYASQSPLWMGSKTVRLANGELQSLDNRPPVVDSYEMVATTDPLEPPCLELPEAADAMNQPCRSKKRKELQHAVKMLKDQARALLASSKNNHVDASLRSHYGRVGMELLAEISSLRSELDEEE